MGLPLALGACLRICLHYAVPHAGGGTLGILSELRFGFGGEAWHYDCLDACTYILHVTCMLWCCFLGGLHLHGVRSILVILIDRDGLAEAAMNKAGKEPVKRRNKAI
ncbi:hypothetical protein V8C35DRAFT_297424 [Trichoderma chlorosporum]